MWKIRSLFFRRAQQVIPNWQDSVILPVQRANHIMDNQCHRHLTSYVPVLSHVNVYVHVLLQ